MADAVANVFLETLRDLLVDETKFLLGVGADVEKVKRDLESVHALLMKADRERHDSPTLEPYIHQLKDLAFKAENLLEKYAVEVQSKREGGWRSLKNKFQTYICIMSECYSVHKIGKEACDIIPSLDQLTKELKSELDQQGSSSDSKQEAKRLLRLTLSHDVESDFVGMEKDIKLLVSKVKDETRRRRVVKIYGMGGLGKSTLARKIYNHEDLQSYARAWVCITQHFQPKAVFGKILKDLDKDIKVDVLDVLEVDDLVTRIQSFLKERKCLVVIDDIWEDVHWEIIKQAFPLNCDVILTTRSEDIANQQSEPHRLEFLTKDEGWTLLQKVADISPDDPDLKSFEDIGRKIVSKCEGLPLSICVIGGILRNKVHTQWIEVNLNMESHLKHGKGVGKYEKVNQVLELSYDALPYYLKPCFLYLACFPEDHKIDTEKLYLLWMAEGFISYQDKEANETLRDVAQRYLIELGMRCMVQLHEADTYTPLTKFVSCGLHDLMHDLCSSKAEKEQFLMRIDASKYLTDILLPTRIAISYDPNSKPSIGLKEVRGLRSFIGHPKHYYRNPTMGFKEGIVNFKMSQYFRIFVVEGCEFEGGKLPSKVGELIHLRYLSLRDSNVRELPKSICSLPYLQTLDLRVSPDIKLPNVTWMMKRLKHLFLDTDIEVIGGEKLKLGGLQELETLDEISSETTCMADIPALISLQKMSVEVWDVDVDNMSIVLNNINRQLRERYLSVRSCDFSSDKGREVLNHGLMSPSLVSLMMWQCIMSSSFPYYKPEMCQNLVTLWLVGCKVKVDVKDFGKYPMLQELWLDKVEMEETLTCHSDSFPRLQRLQLSILHDLKVWEAEEGALPKLTFFSIFGCPNLEKLPDGLRSISTLRRIYIRNMPREFMERVNEEDYGPFVEKDIKMDSVYKP